MATDNETTDNEIRDCYRRQGVELATEWEIFAPLSWSANSQYGYALEWFATREGAEEYALGYYRERMGLIRQDGTATDRIHYDVAQG